MLCNIVQLGQPSARNGNNGQNLQYTLDTFCSLIKGSVTDMYKAFQA